MVDSPPLSPDMAPLERWGQPQLDGLVALHERFLQGRIGGRRATIKRIDLSGLTLAGRQLRQSDFSGCIMRNMDLSKTNFQEASLYACDLSHANLNDAKFIRADLRGAQIESANLIGTDLEKADLRMGAMSVMGQTTHVVPNAVNFRGANLTGARLSGVMGANVNFADAIMNQVDMKNADFRGANFVGADMTGARVAGALLAGASLLKTILTGVTLSDIRDNINIDTAITDENVGFSISTLTEPLPKLIEDHRLWVETSGKNGRQLDLSGYDLRDLVSLKREKLTAIKAVGAKFFGMNLFSIELQNATLDGSDFRNCDMEGADLRASTFKGANLNHTRLKGANMAPLMFGSGSNGRFAPCDFSKAELRYADLTDAVLKNGSFQGTDLSYANLTNADLREADFTGANLTGAILENANTTGAMMPENGTGRAFSIESVKQDNT